MVGGHGDVHTCKQSLGCAHLNMLTSGEGLAPAESGGGGGGAYKMLQSRRRERNAAVCGCTAAN